MVTSRWWARAAPPAGRPEESRETPPIARPWLLVNAKSGDRTAERVGLIDAARAKGITVHVLGKGDDPAALARGAIEEGADAVGAAGGDGSLAAIAEVAIEREVPFVCVPAGTRNHFAHDLGLDRSDPLAALEAFRGRERRIDAARVGERLFLNNVSLGAYAEVISEPGYRDDKLKAGRVVVGRMMRGEQRLPPLDVCDPTGQTYREPLVLLVGNNRYQLKAGNLGGRDHLDRGVLQVSVLQTRAGGGLARLVARLVLGRIRSDSRWAQWDTTTLRVDSGLPAVPAGVDGEAVELPTPLEFKLLPRALRVLVPR